MRATSFLAGSLFASIVSFQATAAQAVQDNHVKLTVVKYDDHVQIECSPTNKDTSTRENWKTICNEMAAPQIQELAAAGTIAPIVGAVFDLSAGDTAASQPLSKSIALSQQHL